VIFGLLLAWDVWEAVGNLLGVIAFANQYETSVSGVGWFVLLLAVGLPLAGFLGVLWFGRRSSPIGLMLAYLTATAVVAALSFDILSIYGPLSLIV
jgi:hypothetical protein